RAEGGGPRYRTQRRGGHVHESGRDQTRGREILRRVHPRCDRDGEEGGVRCLDVWPGRAQARGRFGASHQGDARSREMKIWLGLGAALLAAASAPQAPRPPAACRDAFEAVNRTREILADPTTTDTRLEQLLAALELRSGSCPTAGDVWYYRSLLERRLKRPARDADY